MGRIITLWRKQIFDFTFLGTSAIQTITIKRSLPIVPFYYYWLGLRIHNVAIVTGNFSVQLPQTLPSGQDPQEFTETGVPTLNITVNSGTTAPSLKTVLTNNLGPYLKVIIKATQGTGGNQLYAETSAVLFSRAP